ncbi:signal peptidase I [Gordonia liuliyuniae]|uniref:Signal peptidase I n=1 Tax=Gordonia liuliyuniae TaxID=2911517 RepID=A0ABS9IWN8_9ACTN|nr:signal peptidase I [Gordonia liuliyuniae]MCF8589978.1 signal peptidase I [Gordonia liuliyuniae]
MNGPAVRRRGRIGHTALSVAAVLGVLCIVSTLIALLTGVRPVIFETGSMAPTIPTGSLGISKTVPATELRPGDVVGVVREDGVRVTHRVVAVDGVAGNSVTLTMRGDGNDAPDHDSYIVTDGALVYGSVPFVGYVAAWLRNPYTVALQALAAMFLLAVAFAPRNGWRRSTTAQRLLTGTAAASVVVVVASSLHASGDAHAERADQATATGSLTAISVNAPASLTCANDSGLLFQSAIVSWPVLAQQRGVFTYSVMSGTTELGTVVKPTQDRASFTIYAGLITSLLNAVLGQTFSVHVVAKVGNWTSAPSMAQTLLYRALLPSGPACVTPGTTPAAAGRTVQRTNAPSADPSAAAPPESATPTDSDGHSSESAPPPGSTSTSATPELPAGGTLAASGSYAFYQDGSQLTIREASSTEIVYRGDFPSGSDVRWLPGTDDLEVTAPDGTVTVVSAQSGEWTTSVTPPPTSERPTPDTSKSETVQPTESSTPDATPTDDAASA